MDDTPENERPKLTDGQKQAYLRDTDRCPFCHTEGRLVAESFDVYESSSMSRPVICDHCGRTFREVYGLQFIEDYD